MRHAPSLLAGAVLVLAACDSGEDESEGPGAREALDSRMRLEVVDHRDPVPVDQEVTYTIRVTNPGSAPQTNVRITAEPPGALRILSAKGPTELEGQDGTVTFKPLGSLAPGQRATWTVTARAAQEGDVRVRVRLESDQLSEPTTEEEPTRFIQ